MPNDISAENTVQLKNITYKHKNSTFRWILTIDNEMHLPSMYNGFTTSWFNSSKFSCPIQCSTLRFLPVKKLSTTVTSCPCIMSLSTKWLPTNPAPPVIYKIKPSKWNIAAMILKGKVFFLTRIRIPQTLDTYQYSFSFLVW